MNHFKPGDSVTTAGIYSSLFGGQLSGRVRDIDGEDKLVEVETGSGRVLVHEDCLTLTRSDTRQSRGLF